jgi:maltose-binding protein MalE
MKVHSWSRRHFLSSALGAGGLAAIGLLAACSGAPAASPTAAPTSAPAAQPTSAPAAAATATSAPAAQGVAGTTPTTAAAPAAGAAATATVAPITATLKPTQFTMNNAKITAWAWQSFSPAADKWIAAQAMAWGKSNGGTVEYDVVDNSVFTQKLSAAIEAKTVPDVIMLSGVLYY